jgi:hypothetical protein
MIQPINWRIALQEWLENNSKQIPEDLKALRQSYLRQFPREQLDALTLESYALGLEDSQDSLCYWLEYKTKQLCNVGGGSAAKWGIWWSKKDNRWAYNKAFGSEDPQTILDTIKEGLIALLNAAENEQYNQLDAIGDEKLGRNRNSLRAKPLYMYFPDQFLPISNPVHLEIILNYFGQQPKKGAHARNQQLLTYLQSLPEFEGFETLQISRFLYAYNLNKPYVVFQNEATLTQTIQFFARFANSAQYYPSEYDYKAALLQALKEALDPVSEDDPTLMVSNLAEWASDFTKEINNLTSWQQLDVFKQYLTAVPAVTIQQQLQGLLDEDGDLQERIDSFRESSEGAYQQFTGKPGHFSLGFMTLLLMGANQESHIIYRAQAIGKACDDWGVTNFTNIRNDGEKYEKLQALAPHLQTRLTKALDRPANLIDVHSLIWFNYTEEYDAFKQIGSGPIEVIEERPFMRDLLRITQRTKNVILYGPPGTGKTYWLQQYSQRFTAERTRFVTFHQSFAYEEFVEGLKPRSVDGQIRYDVMPGVFRQICQDAAADSDNPYLLVIDEVNRANIAKVFGELITLIEDDKRLGAENEIKVTLPYSGESFGVPNNLTILGTMNTADRSIALLDIALRRRFTFVPVMPNPNYLKTDIQGVSLQQLLQRLNERIARMLDKDHQIGHSYFMNITNLADLRFVWKHRILPLLEEYFYSDGERLHALLGDKFVILQSMDGTGDNTFSDRFDFGTGQYGLPELSDETFVTSLQELAGQSSE